MANLVRIALALAFAAIAAAPIATLASAVSTHSQVQVVSNAGEAAQLAAIDEGR